MHPETSPPQSASAHGGYASAGSRLSLPEAIRDASTSKDAVRRVHIESRRDASIAKSRLKRAEVLQSVVMRLTPLLEAGKIDGETLLGVVKSVNGDENSQNGDEI